MLSISSHPAASNPSPQQKQTATAGADPSKTAAPATPSPATPSPAPSSPAASSSDAVALSKTAKAALSGSLSDKIAYYKQYMPTRAGFSSTALAAAVADPGGQSFSAGKSFAQVASAARAELNKQYSKMASSGLAYDAKSREDRNSAFGNLDRRALSAVASNQGGLFTKEERQIAANLMAQQRSLAIGIYSGPPELKGTFIDRFAGHETARQQANIAFLDHVSDDEKGTDAWASARADAEGAVHEQPQDAGLEGLKLRLFAQDGM